MAGDAINIFGKSFHKKPVAGYTSSVNGVIVSELINGFAGTSIISAKGVTGSQITGQAGFTTTVGANGQLSVSSNATADTKKMVSLINQSGSRTASDQFVNISNSATKTHIVVDTKNTGADGFSLLGYHQPHDAKGNKLAYKVDPKKQGSGKFDGEVAFIKDNNGKLAFKEATITVFEKSFTPKQQK